MPVPAQALDYGRPARARPAVLTAVGVLSIIFGLIYAGSAGFSGITTYSFLQMNRMIRTANARGTGFMAVPPVPAVAAPVQRPAAGDQMAAAEVAAFVDALDRSHSLNAADQAALGDVLSKIGWQVLNQPPTGSRSAEALVRFIADSGDTSDGGTFYALPGGRLQVGDGTALFIARDGTITAGVANAVSAPTTGPVGVSYTFRGASSRFTPATRPTTMPFPFTIQIPTGAATLSLVESGLRLALAVWLLIAGILTLRNVPRARRMHLWWAVFKLPLLPIGAAASYNVWTPVFTGMFANQPASTAASVTGAVLSMTVSTAFIGAIYPITVLILMNVRSTKRFYNSESANAGRTGD